MLDLMTATGTPHPKPAGIARALRWFGPSALMALGVFFTGRLLMEPLRPLPRFDEEGMDPFSVVETYQLRERSEPFEIGVFGSSVSIWGVLPEVIAEELDVPENSVRKLAVQGGTPFDMWQLLQRNPEKFEKMRTAVVEINPRMLDDDQEGGRMSVTVAQHASLDERELLTRKVDRWKQRGDLVLPILSVRRPVKDAMLDVLNTPHLASVHPHPDRRLTPHGPGWHVEDEDPVNHLFVDSVTADKAARRIMGNWHLSRLHHDALKKSLAWFKDHGVIAICHQMPVHPDVASHLKTDEKVARGYAAYNAFVKSLDLPEGTFLQPLSCLDCGIPVHGMRDHTHLNRLGATIYSEMLAGLIENTGSGSSNRGNGKSGAF